MTKSSFIAFAICLVDLSAVFAQTHDNPRAHLITVRGIGEASGKPDLAILSIGVVTVAESPIDAVERNNEAMRKLIDALKIAGIDEAKIQTIGFNVVTIDEVNGKKHKQQPPQNPSVNESAQTSQNSQHAAQQAQIAGYEATNRVRVTVEDLTKLTNLLKEAVQAGANRIDGISFGLKNRDELLAKARRTAVNDARQGARTFAQAANVVDFRLVAITDEQLVVEPVSFENPFKNLDGADVPFEIRAAVPIMTGEATVSVRISVVYAIGDR